MKGEKTLALFKIFKGKKINLPKTYNEGYCYFTEDDGKFYIDTTSEASGRKCLNANEADHAATATKADKADLATNATNAGHADSATSADSATTADGLKTGSTLNTQQKIDDFLTANTLKYNLFNTTDTNNINFQGNDGMLISIPWSSTAYGSQLAIDDDITPNIKIRGKANGSWGDWSQFLLNSNYTNYTVKKDGTGASGTWGIDISGNAATATTATKADSATRATTAGSADSVLWNNVSGKPDSFPPSAHTHSEYVNQNAFSNIKINSGTTPIAATSTTDTFNLIAGNNVTITNNGKNITISSKDNNTAYSLSSSKSANNTNTYLTLTPSSGSSNNIQIKGTGATSISTDSNGVISINSPTVPTIPSLSKGTNTTATKTLAHTGTFTAITGFAVSGHTITPEVTTFTMPSDNNTTYSAGTGISITGTANTITNTGVRSITSGTANGTISVNTNGTTANVEVKGLGSAAYTNSSDYQSAVTGAASTITGSNLTASRALISNASGKVAVSSVTSTELGYLSGVTSAIQTQLNGTVKTTGNQTISGTKTFSSGGIQLSTNGTILTDDAELIAAYNALA